jgi:hypothetical protein
VTGVTLQSGQAAPAPTRVTSATAITRISVVRAAFSTTNGDILAIAKVSGAAHEIAIGGNFTTVTTRDGKIHAAKNFAVLNDSTGAVLYAGNVNSYVRAITSYRGTIYLGGKFTSVAGEHRVNLAAVTPTFAVSSWKPIAGASVEAIAVNASGVIWGGDGTYLRKVSRNTGAQIWKQRVSGGGVRALLLTSTGSTLYVGGLFDLYAGVGRHGIARVSAATGSLDRAFNARLKSNSHRGSVGGYDGEEVLSMALIPGGTHLIAGIGGFGTNEVRDLHYLSGITAHRTNLPGDGQAVGIVGSSYVVGYHRNHGNVGTSFPYFACQFATLTGHLTAWNPKITGNQQNADGGNNGVQAMLVDPTARTIFLAGAFTNYSGVYRVKSLIAFHYS